MSSIQTRPGQHLGAVCNHHAIPLLRLPFSVRERIYRYAGLMTGYRLTFGCWTFHPDSYDTCTLASIYPQITREVEALVLQHNTFVFDDAPYSLQTVQPEACASLRDIYIHLYEKPFVDLSPIPALEWSQMREWHVAAEQLLRHATPGKLRLHLICDVGGDMNMAKAVLAPFESFPKQLKELELYLSSTPNPSIKKLMQEVGSRAHIVLDGHEEPRSGSFPFLDLPIEIRHQIYRQTALVLPYRKALWQPNGGFSHEYVACECDGTICRDREIHSNNAFERCDAGEFGDKKTTTFCSSSGGSTYSPHCNHHTTRSLFLASRAMYHDAMQFFLTYNRITICSKRNVDTAISMWDPQYHQPLTAEQRREFRAAGHPVPPYHGEETPGSTQITRNPLRLFIDKVGTAALPHLREIEIILPRQTSRSSLDDTAQVYTDWCEAVDLLAQHATLDSLTIMLHIFTHRATMPWPVERTEALRRAQSLRVIAPLHKLSQVKNLFIFLEWPHHWASTRLQRDIDESGMPEKECDPASRIGWQNIPVPDPVLVEEETQLEKRVMGETYDSFATGKGDVLPSQWLRVTWNSV